MASERVAMPMALFALSITSGVVWSLFRIAPSTEPFAGANVPGLPVVNRGAGARPQRVLITMPGGITYRPGSSDRFL